ncbi:peptidyl-tRNA hydrolase ICT1, mitochondrial-like [Denticeps clupeoides]|uniref:peptidyl-tRNA hydrolase ICT1, mitochondrial-like n=1 Tax=Denticeps clupeoides TaxID=299321 RepID=UPI0010A34EFB|nr:peptidyl-tRNA hydrolase ICT1, mitochondrial-like [Denticeps clupeoides]
MCNMLTSRLSRRSLRDLCVWPRLIDKRVDNSPFGSILSTGCQYRGFCSGSSEGSDASQKGSHIRIPVDRLKIAYSRSSGPGGQHVNKVSSKAEVRFHLQAADWIPEDVRSRMQERNKRRLNKAGELLVTSEVSRSQHRNLEDCLRKIADIIADSSQKAPEPSEDDIALRAERLEKRNQARLKQKKIHSGAKRDRRVDFD